MHCITRWIPEVSRPFLFLLRSKLPKLFNPFIPFAYSLKGRFKGHFYFPFCIYVLFRLFFTCPSVFLTTPPPPSTKHRSWQEYNMYSGKISESTSHRISFPYRALCTFYKAIRPSSVRLSESAPRPSSHFLFPFPSSIPQYPCRRSSGTGKWQSAIHAYSHHFPNHHPRRHFIYQQQVGSERAFVLFWAHISFSPLPTTTQLLEKWTKLPEGQRRHWQGEKLL